MGELENVREQRLLFIEWMELDLRRQRQAMLTKSPFTAAKDGKLGALGIERQKIRIPALRHITAAQDVVERADRDVGDADDAHAAAVIQVVAFALDLNAVDQTVLVNFAIKSTVVRIGFKVGTEIGIFADKKLGTLLALAKAVRQNVEVLVLVLRNHRLCALLVGLVNHVDDVLAQFRWAVERHGEAARSDVMRHDTLLRLPHSASSPTRYARGPSRAVAAKLLRR